MALLWCSAIIVVSVLTWPNIVVTFLTCPTFLAITLLWCSAIIVVTFLTCPTFLAITLLWQPLFQTECFLSDHLRCVWWRGWQIVLWASYMVISVDARMGDRRVHKSHATCARECSWEVSSLSMFHLIKILPLYTMTVSEESIPGLLKNNPSVYNDRVWGEYPRPLDNILSVYNDRVWGEYPRPLDITSSVYNDRVWGEYPRPLDNTPSVYNDRVWDEYHRPLDNTPSVYNDKVVCPHGDNNTVWRYPCP